VNKKRLGRGLAALLGTEEGGFEPASLEAAELLHLPVDQIDPNPYQPRRDFEPAELAALADSLRQHGMLQPVIVRPCGERYQLIAGERRHRAAIEAHLHEIPARVLELDDQRVNELAMVENLQREDLNALEKATAFKGYLDRYGGTQEELASRLGLDRSTIANLIRLLDLPPDVQEALRSRQISAGHARALLALGDPEAIASACRQIIAENLSVRQTEALVAAGAPARTRRVRVDAAHGTTEKPPHFVEFELSLRERLGTNVLVRPRGKQKGQIVIEYHSAEAFERISALIRG
jgi:ParB family chromosome partitioning protein